MINKLIVSTLKPLLVPIEFQRCTSKADTYITFFTYSKSGELYTDDAEDVTAVYIQVDLWSKKDYTALSEKLLKRMLDAGFTRTSEAEFYEDDTQIYHKAFRFKYLMEGE